MLVTASYDVAADYVTSSLNRLGLKPYRLDTDAFPQDAKISFDPKNGVSIRRSGEQVLSGDVGAVWYRRLVRPALPPAIAPATREFCERETRAFLSGVLSTLTPSRWLSDPAAVAVAERKPYQLKIAHEVGFRVPETRVTNDPETVRQLTKDRMSIAKAVSSGYIENPDGYSAIFTNLVSNKDLEDLETLRLAPVTFQEFVDKSLDVRVTVVGDAVFPAAILSQLHPSSRVDWRATEDADLPHERHDLPAEVARLCTQLVRRLGLNFGAIDLALTTAGDYVFFEINPNGEWVWIEEQLGYPISDTIAQWLSAGLA